MPSTKHFCHTRAAELVAAFFAGRQACAFGENGNPVAFVFARKAQGRLVQTVNLYLPTGSRSVIFNEYATSEPAPEPRPGPTGQLCVFAFFGFLADKVGRNGIHHAVELDVVICLAGCQFSIAFW